MDEFTREWQLIQESGLKDSALRREYERKVRELRRMPAVLLAEGKTEEQIPRAYALGRAL